MATTTLYINESIRAVLHIAGAFAKENYNATYGAPHLLRALLHKETGLEAFITSTGNDLSYLREWAEVRIEDFPKINRLPDHPDPDEIIATLLEIADTNRLRLGLEEVNALCLLAATIKPGIAFTPAQLKSFPLREADFAQLVHPSLANGDATENALTSIDDTTRKSSLAPIATYCLDKTAQAKLGKLDPIIGRERETRQMIEILGRRSKPNVILTGEPGVGKTALIDGFAQALIAGEVPEHLTNAHLFELDLGALMAGAAYKGEVEDRMKKILSALKTFDKAILFIDELHVLLDPKGPMGSGVGNLLKPELARGELTVLGATTLEEYRKIIEPEQAFNRRFERLLIAEPDTRSAEKMLALLVPRYEAHHQLTVDKAAIPACVQLAKRYIKDKRLPDAALDLLDQTLAATRLARETTAKALEQAGNALQQIMGDQTLEDDERLAELLWWHRTLQERISPVLTGALKEDTPLEKMGTPEALSSRLQELLKELEVIAGQESTGVSSQDIAAMVSAKTKIPIGKIQSGEKEKLIHMEQYLKRRMIGQEHALKAISEAIIENRSGINKPGQPIGSFFLLGPTGTGKTELAKSIAELLFNDEKAMIRFDMSEFKEEHSAALLYGAPPGYVGYEEGGMLVNKIRQQPYSVVLFDEIEKAHTSVFDVFLQIMDEGHIHDKLGKEGDFSNALILFTSNVGSDYITEQFEKQIVPSTHQLMERMSSRFRPEFLARLTEIIPFSPVSEDMAVRIFNLQLQSLLDILEKRNIGLRLAPETGRMLALGGFDPKFGARQIAGTIRQKIRRPVSRMIVSGEIKAGDKIEVRHNDEGELIWK